MAVIFTPRDLATDFAWNEVVEREIASMVQSQTGLEPHDFSLGARGQYDWKWGECKVELKTTLSQNLKVEVSKDPEGNIPSGLGGSSADVALVLMRGYRNLSDGGTYTKGKLRMFNRSRLVSYAKRVGRPYSITTGRASEHEYGYEIVADHHTVVGHANELWLADIEIVSRADGTDAYDLSQVQYGYTNTAREWVTMLMNGEL